MTSERLGELTASIAWALMQDATAIEIAYIEQKWDEVGKLLSIALAVASGAKSAVAAIVGGEAPAATV